MAVLRKYRQLLLSVFCLGLSLLILIKHKQEKGEALAKELKIALHQQELKLKRFLESESEKFLKNPSDYERKVVNESPYFLHIYSNDSLIYWNTNKLPVSQFASIQYPSNGIYPAQNGWYYAKMKSAFGYTFCASFVILKDFPYENDYLKNTFNSSFDFHFQGEITLDPQLGIPVVSDNQKYLFSFIPDQTQPYSAFEIFLITFGLLAFICLNLIRLFQRYRVGKKSHQLSIVLSVLVVHFLLLNFHLLSYFEVSDLLGPKGFASNWFNSSFLALIVNCLFLVWYLSIFVETSKRNPGILMRTPALIIGGISVYGLWWMYLRLLKALVFDSSISLQMNELFNMNWASLVFLILIAILGWAYYNYVFSWVKLALRKQVSPASVQVTNFCFGLLFIFSITSVEEQLTWTALFPLILAAILVYFEYTQRSVSVFNRQLSVLVLFTSTIVVGLASLNRDKEQVNRLAYAQKLSEEKDIRAELDFSELKKRIQDDKYIKHYLSAQNLINPSDFDEGMERRHFSGYWEKYEINNYLFDTINQCRMLTSENSKELYKSFQAILAKNGTVSEIDSHLYFIQDFTNQLSYISIIPLEKDGVSLGALYSTYKSKKIPEEIGFPRLLISQDASILDNLSGYSVAKYHENRLVQKFGDFNFPTAYSSLLENNPQGYNNFEYQGYNHFVEFQSQNDQFVLSNRSLNFTSLLTSFSYLFCLFGLFLLLYIYFHRNSILWKKTLPLASKIQLALLGIVFLSLVGFGIGNGVFIRNQYQQNTQETISEKLQSIHMELFGKLGMFDELTLENDGAYLNQLLRKFSQVFVTDINLYDPKGILIGTSRSKVYNAGLLSEQMNPIAKREMVFQNKSEFVHLESIGELEYSSAYVPLFGENNQHLGYINSQHFGQQEDFEQEIQAYIVTIINVFMGLLLLSLLMTVILSNWLTLPLRLLQESFSNIRFGKENQRIEYTKQDEIGELVAEYNKKLEELEFTANQLAQSERESAWRDMAKQVAHEIKNPLTPMKLSVQHLLRSFDPEDPKSASRIQRVGESLIEQIDSLTRIANEFSNFAKMPQLQLEPINLSTIILHAIEVHRNEANIAFFTNIPESVSILGDKEQLLRVFNNLIKNSIQAIPENRDGQIHIDVTVDLSTVTVSIQDNGKGITAEDSKRIFTPYFTTKSGGSGIGLAMVKQIVNNHGGSIDFSSQEQVGTQFNIQLPLDE